MSLSWEPFETSWVSWLARVLWCVGRSLSETIPSPSDNENTHQVMNVLPFPHPPLLQLPFRLQCLVLMGPGEEANSLPPHLRSRSKSCYRYYPIQPISASPYASASSQHRSLSRSNSARSRCRLELAGVTVTVLEGPRGTCHVEGR